MVSFLYSNISEQTDEKETDEINIKKKNAKSRFTGH
jgi:hypothetical protein